MPMPREKVEAYRVSRLACVPAGRVLPGGAFRPCNKWNGEIDIDWVDLNAQKGWLVEFNNKHFEEFKEEHPHAAGLISFLDALQDMAADNDYVPEGVVFYVEPPDPPPDGPVHGAGPPPGHD